MKPTQNQMVLPLLECMKDMGGKAGTQDLYNAVSERLDVAEEIRSQRASLTDGRTVNAFEREVRWAMQRAKLKGLAAPEGKAIWSITGKGVKALKEALPGIVLTFFETAKGMAIFGHCEDAIGYIEDSSINLIFTSPPYPLLREKAYGNCPEQEYVEWLLRIMEQWPRKLTGNGSIVLNLGETWMPGQPSLSLYQERLLIRLQDELGLKLCQRFAWQNPSKMPAPAEWVTIRRVRVKPSLEYLYWLSPHDHPYANNSNVFRPYSESMLKLLEAGGEKAYERPSGYELKAGSFSADNGGSIPDNLLVHSNAESNSDYIRSCKAASLPVHPARFPKALPEFFINFLTREWDRVADFFGGSLTTAAAAEDCNRYWVACEPILEYLQGAKFRFKGGIFPAQAA